ncbi:class I SAM-dependent methyltransferase [bacterium]|nr:class I SAM-dependent methyltransferase [bacterium]
MSADTVPAWPPYDEWATQFSTSYQRCGWQSADSQRARYHAVMGSIPLVGMRVLDMGCGDGELYQTLQEESVDCQYKGIDQSEAMIQQARSRFPGVAFSMGVATDAFETIDVTVAIGMTCHPMPEYWRTVSGWMAHWLASSEVGVCVSFLSTLGPRQNPRLCYVAPETALSWGLSITPYVSLNHGYLINDFLLTLYRR